MFLLQCPKCGNKMKCQPTKTLEGKRKQCVYCPSSFTVSKHIIKRE